MSVKSYLAEHLPSNPSGSVVFAWAEAQGKARNTVLIQARKLGFVYDKKSDTFAGGAPLTETVERHDPDTPAQPAEVPKGARGSRQGFDYGTDKACEHTVKEWRALMDAAPQTKRLDGGDVLIFHKKGTKLEVRYEVYDL